MYKSDDIQHLEMLSAEYYRGLPRPKTPSSKEVRKAFEDYFRAHPVASDGSGTVRAAVVAVMADVVAAIDRELPYMNDQYEEEALELYNFLIDTAIEWSGEGLTKAHNAVFRFPEGPFFCTGENTPNG